MMYLSIACISNIIALVIMFAAVIYFYLTQARFHTEEFKDIVSWIFLTSYFFFMIQIVSVYGVLFDLPEEYVLIQRAAFAILTCLLFIITTFKILSLSKTYGFTETKLKKR